MDEPIATQETKTVSERPHIHVDIHVHLDGPVVTRAVGHRDRVDDEIERGSPSAAPTRRSLLTTLLVGFGVSAVGYVGFRAGSVSSQQKDFGVNQAAVSQGSAATASPAPLPDALARDLQRPPQITPAPGTPAGASQSGPAAFGLQQ
ncbi:hypothetical protein [Methylosinus sp. R-45379]|uniref:hypothetical protein n=1 Tax=Methylosinus sp. R-45379 TaxID=980563 RepID=UPI000A4CC9AD|nr:hypothetical protein [Methylosinus sp. R-45379]